MRKNSLLLLVAAAMLALSGCGDDEEGSVRNCSTNADCTEGSEICHPIGLVCVPTCDQGSDCPSNQRNCDTIKDGNGQPLTTEKVCQCQTTELCNEDTSGLVCSTIDNICEAECTEDADCADFNPARVCQDGQCVFSQVTPTCTDNSQCTDASASRCSDGVCAACAADTDCSHLNGLPMCDNGTCVAALACDPQNRAPGDNGGQDTCAYGELCSASGCEAVPTGTCSGATSAQGYSWDQQARAPVIVRLTNVAAEATSDPQNECGGGTPKLQATVEFYAPNGLSWSSQADLQQRFRFVTSSGQVFPAAFVKNLTGSSPLGFGSALVGSCTSGTSAPSLAGRAIFIQDASGNQGNIVCLQ